MVTMTVSTIVCYDICNPKRLRKVYQKCRGYGEHLQYSVFRCELTERRRASLMAELDELIDHREDQVLFIRVGRPEGRAKTAFEALGRAYKPRMPGPVIV